MQTPEQAVSRSLWTCIGDSTIIEPMSHESTEHIARAVGSPKIMGILNVTPDSFSDGGQFLDPHKAVDHGLKMIADGADILDIGAESSRPGADSVDAEEQIRRAIPVIEAIRKANAAISISIDTRSARVATAALDVGADIINDISALRDDEQMGAVVAKRKCRLILMHMQGQPSTMQQQPEYKDAVAESVAFLRERIDFAQSAGIEKSQLIVDPGIGFGKTTAHNLTIMARLEEYAQLGVPVLLGASRKRFLDELAGGRTKPDERLGGSLACVARAIEAKVQIVRVHDVADTRRFIVAQEAIRRQCG